LSPLWKRKHGNSYENTFRVANENFYDSKFREYTFHLFVTQKTPYTESPLKQKQAECIMKNNIADLKQVIPDKNLKNIHLLLSNMTNA